MKNKIDSDSGSWLTPQQFFAIVEEKKCSCCDAKAKWFTQEAKGPSYCDKHFPCVEKKQSQ